MAARAGALAAELAAGPTAAYAETKRLLADGGSRPLTDSLAAECAAQQRLGTTTDHGNAVRAFLAKQRPAFVGSYVRHPLDGLTVVSLEQAVAAPFATRQLADLGARVIKIERPGGGDFARGYDRTTLGQSSHFIWLNRGKESVELDVKDAGDRALLGRLLDAADVFVQNLAPGAADRLGLGPPSLRAERPGLICCSISGYGADGPYRDKKAYDLLVQCEAGLVMATGTADTPARPGISIADIAAGMYAYTGILTALYDRERTGSGATLQVAMIDALGRVDDPAGLLLGLRRAAAAPDRGAASFDLAVRAVQRVRRRGLLRDSERAGVAGVLPGGAGSAAELAVDPRFASNPDRAARNDELTAIIEDVFAKQTADEVIAALEAAGIACARLRAPGELTSHPELRARGRWVPVGTPGGDVDALLPAVQVGRAGAGDGAGARVRRAHRGDPGGVRGLGAAPGGSAWLTEICWGGARSGWRRSPRSRPRSSRG